MQKLHETVEIVETVGRPTNRRNLTEVSQESQNLSAKYYINKKGRDDGITRSRDIEGKGDDNSRS